MSVNRVVVVGLGKIGLPLAIQLASRGLDVIGVDVSERGWFNLPTQVLHTLRKQA